MLSQKLKSTAKLTRTELKNVMGGNDQDQTLPPFCPKRCSFDDNGGSIGCPENRHCEEFQCWHGIYTTRCVA